LRDHSPAMQDAAVKDPQTLAGSLACDVSRDGIDNEKIAFASRTGLDSSRWNGAGL
jgi:hypothetical protein